MSVPSSSSPSASSRPAPRRGVAVAVAVSVVLLLFCSRIGGASAGADASTSAFSLDLPREFSIRLLPSSTTTTTATAPAGPELVWVPSVGEVRVGGSRPEFRLGTDALLGYPKEKLDASTGKLVLALPLTPPVQDDLISDAGGRGQNLQVWSSGRRLDAGGAASASAAPTPSPPSEGNGSSLQDPSTTSLSNSTPATAATAATVLMVKAAPTVRTNPAEVGPHKIRRRSYNLPPGLNVTGYEALLEVLAEVTYPRELPTNASLGPAPFVLFLHGRHETCYTDDGSTTGEWPCPPGYTPIPSLRGYRYVADLLASRGYVAVSIAANAINGLDSGALDAGASARSELIRHHLDLWAGWNAAGGDPWSGLFRGKLDLTRVVLVGHSRGGEGVNRAAIDAATSGPDAPLYKIVGLVSYGPTAFGRQVNPGVHSATLLPTCDGDVSDLQGQAYVDSSRDVASSTALRSAVIVLGANHNYFNTEWTPGLSAAPSQDDWSYGNPQSDPVCGTNGGAYRLTPREQQVVGAAYTLALVRLAVQQDQAMLPLLDGTFVRPQSIGRANVVTHAVGGTGYRLLYKAESPGTPILGKGMQGYECQGYLPSGSANPMPECTGFFTPSPHFLPWYALPTRPAPQALLLSWTKAGALARFRIEPGQRNFRGLDSVDARVANYPYSAKGSQLDMWLLDGQGRIAKLATSLDTIEGWPGTATDGLYRIHARALRGSLALPPTTAFNLRNVTQVILAARGASGRVWVLDVAASRRRTKAVPDLNLPVVSAELLFVPEGDGPNPVTVQANVTSDRPFPTAGSIWIEKGGAGGLLTIPSGTDQVIQELSFSFVGDNEYTFYPSSSSTTVKIGAVTGAVVSSYIGGVDVVEDEAGPTLTAVARTVTVSEGQSLVWNFLVSSTDLHTDFRLYCYIVPPTVLLSNQTELSSADVPRWWLADVLGGPPPSVAVPFSELFVYLQVDFGPTATSGSITIPTRTDGVAEAKDEVVSLYCTDFQLIPTLLLTGIVRANRL